MKQFNRTYTFGICFSAIYLSYLQTSSHNGFKIVTFGEEITQKEDQHLKKKCLSHSKNLYLTGGKWDVRPQTVFSKVKVNTFLAFCFRGAVCMECFTHRWMRLHKCQGLIMSSVPRALEPLERKFRNLECPSKALCLAGLIKETKGFKECQS